VSRYEIVRDIPDDWGALVTQRHPDQPEDGFATAVDAHLWSERIPRDLNWQWYIRPVEGTNG